jgi:hypothetical protein
VTDDAAGGRPGARGRGGDLPLRIASALVLALVALIGAVPGGWAAAIVLGIVTAIVSLEWASITERTPSRRRSSRRGWWLHSP